MGKKGFTLIEIIVVLAIIGIIIVASYPSILNTLETRSLEGAAREILTTLETARYLAVNEKIPYRVRFYQQENVWRFIIEKQVRDPDKLNISWVQAPKFLPRTLPPKFNPRLKLPQDQTIIFSPLGMIENYDFDSPQNHEIILQSSKLKSYNQEDVRIVRFYAGGSIGYVKTRS